MGKIAFLYPGQGSQKVGMGSVLKKTDFKLFEEYLARCDEMSGVSVTRYCLEGPLEQLSQTHVAQPALFAYSLALTAYAQQQGLYADFVAGHSLGEYTAAVAAKVLSFEDGLYLVCQRGKFMYQIQNEKPGAMAAVAGVSVETLHEMCVEITQRNLVVITNWNAPSQFVVSGVEAGVQELVELVCSQKQAKATLLPVKGGFHSPLMIPVQSALQEVMRELTWHDASIPLIANVSGAVLLRGQQIHQELIEQITRPIQWISCIETLVKAGCDTFVELGSGQVLTKLVRLIAPDAKAFALDNLVKIAAFTKTRQDAVTV